jgi:hypothetical protein
VCADQRNRSQKWRGIDEPDDTHREKSFENRRCFLLHAVHSRVIIELSAGGQENHNE